MINDGFGDLSEFEIEQELAGYERWLHKTANVMAGDHEELVQEGLIAMWRSMKTFDPRKGARPAWLTSAAKHRMLDVSMKRARPTGSPASASEHGDSRGVKSRDKIRAVLKANPHATGREIASLTGLSEGTVSFHRSRLDIDRDPVKMTSLEELLDLGFNPAAAGSVLDSIINAYHRGEIVQALQVLTPAERKYVEMRFWKGLTSAELKDAFGYAPTALWTTAKKKLAPVLSHLVEA